MVAGTDTFINDLMIRCGFINGFEMERYPEVSNSDLSDPKFELILLSSEPFPFKVKHLHEFSLLLPGTKIQLVDGEMFSWYGSRLIKASAYFKELINTVGLAG